MTKTSTMLTSVAELNKVMDEYMTLGLFGGRTLPSILEEIEFVDYILAMTIWEHVLRTKSVVKELVVKHNLKGHEHTIMTMIQGEVAKVLETKESL